MIKMKSEMLNKTHYVSSVNGKFTIPFLERYGNDYQVYEKCTI